MARMISSWADEVQRCLLRTLWNRQGISYIDEAMNHALKPFALAKLAPLSLALFLAACGEAKGGQSLPATDVTNQTSDTTSAPTVDDTPAIRSVYTDIPQESACRKIGEDIEGASATLRCAGYGNVPLFIKDGDLRTDIDAGVETEFYSLDAFNSPTGKIEWRLAGDDKPFAFIYRLTSSKRVSDKSESGIGKSGVSTSVLLVETIGTTGKPGCTIARVEETTPNANAVARQKADAAQGGKVTCLPT